jgi:hypothetical protein
MSADATSRSTGGTRGSSPPAPLGSGQRRMAKGQPAHGPEGSVPAIPDRGRGAMPLTLPVPVISGESRASLVAVAAEPGPCRRDRGRACRGPGSDRACREASWPREISLQELRSAAPAHDLVRFRGLEARKPHEITVIPRRGVPERRPRSGGRTPQQRTRQDEPPRGTPGTVSQIADASTRVPAPAAPPAGGRARAAAGRYRRRGESKVNLMILRQRR